MFNIAYITDVNYVIPTKASIMSLIQAVDDANVNIHVVAVDVPDNRVRELLALGRGNVRIEVRNAARNEHVTNFTHPYLTEAAFAKIQLAEIFPELDTLLFLDGDTIVSPGFLSIFETDIRSVYAAVVMDMCCMRHGEWHKKLGVARYFNTGVMYLNLAKLRGEGVPAKLRACCARNDYDTTFGEQNAFNVVFGNKVVYLSPKFNYFSCEYPLRRFSAADIASFFDVPEDDFRVPLIRHLAGGRKPWKTATLDVASDWVRYSPPEDHLAIARNYCLSLADEMRMEVAKRYETFDSAIRALDERTLAFDSAIRALDDRTLAFDTAINGLIRRTETLNSQIQAIAKVEATIGQLQSQIAALSAQMEKISDNFIIRRLVGPSVNQKK